MRTIVLLGILALAMIGVGILQIGEIEINEQDQLMRFSSYEDLKNFMELNSEIFSIYYSGACYEGLVTPVQWAGPRFLLSVEGGKVVGLDYSMTNIQVAGVDEADIVKSDGKYIYVISGNKVFIIDAYPAENAKILSEMELDENPIEMFINGDRLIVFGRKSSAYGQVSIKVYDISDLEGPVLERDISLGGDYFDSRMIGKYVYVIVNAGMNYQNGEVSLPEISFGRELKKIPPSEIYYFEVLQPSYTFTIVLSINTQDNEEVISKVFLTGGAQNLFVSLNNVYVTSAGGLSWGELLDDVFMPILPSYVKDEIDGIRALDLNESEKLQAMIRVLKNYLDNQLSDIGRQKFWQNARGRLGKLGNGWGTERTVIHRVSISDGKIEHKSRGEVLGHVLNQFSMDEYQGYFRIATTTGWYGANHVYVLDGDLNITGRLENLAIGERIYSARFMGSRAYLVTFKKVDPLFVIDLADPTNPKVLGELKIPGYSDYLHPYDETHLIGVGKDTEDAGSFAWYQGVKIALFDVSEPENPKEMSKYIVGRRGTESLALQDHKAFLFSKLRNLLVMPIGDWSKQDAHVFHISVENGIVLREVITHLEKEWATKDWYLSSYSVKRSLYIEEALYTISDGMIKINDMENLDELNRIELGIEK